MEGEIVTMSELFRFEREGIDENNNVLGSLRPTGIIPAFHQQIRTKGIELPVELFEP
jgi:pilus assembly protein CpaF